MTGVAACITGTWRTFGTKEVYTSLNENVVQPLVEDGWKVGLFYAIETKGAGISDVTDALQALPPRHLALDVSLPTPDCLRATWAQMHFPMVAQMAQCWHMIEQDTRESSQKWEWVLRLRTDQTYHGSFGRLRELDPSYIYLPPTYTMPFQTSAWGYVYQCNILDDRFALVPWKLAPSYFELSEDMCTPTHTMIFNCFTTHPQYLLSWRLKKERARVQVLTNFTLDTVRGRQDDDAGRTRGSLAAQSEARYQSLVAANASVFGGDVLGDADSDISSHAEQGFASRDLLWSAAQGAARVVLEPGRCFRDHVHLLSTRLCWPNSMRNGSGNGELPGGFFQLRVYRPSDENQQFWRLIGIFSYMFYEEQITQPCREVSVEPMLIAAPGDCLAYVVEDKLGPLASSSLSSQGQCAMTEHRTLLLSNSFAVVGEFDTFEAIPASQGFAISVKHTHLDHRHVGSPYFQIEGDIEYFGEDRLAFFDYCCDMEAQGPEGNARHCFSYIDGIYPDITYLDACIPDVNMMYNSGIKVSNPMYMHRSRGILLMMSRVMMRKKTELQRYLHELNSEDKLAQWKPFSKALDLFSKPWWPAEGPAFRLKPHPHMVPVLIRHPEGICKLVFGTVTDLLHKPDDLEAILYRYCVSTVLTHPRIVARSINASTNHSLVHYFQQAAKRVLEGLRGKMLALYMMD
eukprot:TRINITY_DN41812_c0_g1_i1.p1 TRINITY_DN41812_c0_g1~~TRINITY_DN41812_c0_g1_i1.p1  ORF type:complete len:686 (+),score=75.91 TRINITY_DN41812_c0_g1_i1:224-2281(+)